MKSQGQRDSKRQEQELAFVLNGRTQKASGALRYPSAKGDVRTLGKLRVRAEAKCTTSSWYALQLETVKKIQKEALEGNDDLWVIQLSFTKAQLMLAVCNADWFQQCWVNPRNPDKRRLAQVTFSSSSKSYRISVNDLNKLFADCLENGTVPVLIINFDSGLSPIKESLAIVDWQSFLKVYGVQNEANS